ncbi:hypothetical protein MKX03_029142 [Papaver bracteatum]|nr:hypothetical protein MKX03_029142 [Papaver bracteatum]
MEIHFQLIEYNRLNYAFNHSKFVVLIRSISIGTADCSGRKKLVSRAQSMPEGGWEYNSTAAAYLYFDQNSYRNRMAELLFGHSASEALGQNVCELLVHSRDADEGNEIVERITAGEDWTGQFPVRNKVGEAFYIIVTSTALYDDDGSLVGIICISGDADPFRDVFIPSSGKISPKGCSSTRWLRSSSSTVKPGVNTQQPLQDMVASKISNLASRVSNKVRLKMKTNENTLGPEVQSGDSHYFDQ